MTVRDFAANDECELRSTRQEKHSPPDSSDDFSERLPQTFSPQRPRLRLGGFASLIWDRWPVVWAKIAQWDLMGSFARPRIRAREGSCDWRYSTRRELEKFYILRLETTAGPGVRIGISEVAKSVAEVPKKKP